MLNILFVLVAAFTLTHSVCPQCVKNSNPLAKHLTGYEMNQDDCLCPQDLTLCAIINPVCPAGKQCVMQKIPKCTFTPCQLESAVCVPFTGCPSAKCSNQCPKSGYVKDPNGCQTCVCNDPCSEMTCAADEKCVKVIEVGGGQFGRCDKKAACPKCIAYSNPLTVHMQGIEINADGCQCKQSLTKCSIIDPVCPAGKECVMKAIPVCTFPPCTFQSAVCEPFKKCNPVTCTTTCSKGGFISDPNGCKTCVCKEPCKEITCTSSQMCVTVVEIGGGQTAKCYPKPV